MSISNEIIPFKDQDYDELKSQYNRTNLFKDPAFLATETSIQFSRRMNLNGVRWLRPFEVSQSPTFHEGGFSRLDLDQGQLGNCWFIAACANIAQSEKIFARIVPDDQDFNSDTYAGIFHFRFWLYGTWVDVVVDDRLPFTADGKLLFCSNKQSPDEYWPSLLEKAYAKLYGSYESLDAGQTTDALIDMTGGIPEQFDLKQLTPTDRTNFWTYLEKGFTMGALMGCYIAADPSVKEARLTNGLVRGHAYSITSVKTVGSNRLIRVRNPWGNDVEWKGAWSDGSREWSRLSQDELDELEYQAAKDGEFWMAYNDFMASWDGVQICHLSCDSFSAELLEQDDDSDLIWKCKTYQGAWVPGTSAGGCGQSNQAKFWTNPQYLITLTDVDNDDNENLATLFVSLMQKDSRLKRVANKSDSCEEYIQFRVFKIKDDVEGEEAVSTGSKLYSNQLERVGNSGSYINTREITKRFRLEPGKYLIIPSTYEENRACEFMLRLFTQYPGDASELDQDKDDLNYDDVHYDPQPGDNTYVKWKCFLNPTLYKKIFKVGKDFHKLIKSEGSLDPNLARAVIKDGMDIIQNDLGGLDMNDVKELGDKFKKGFGKFFK